MGRTCRRPAAAAHLEPPPLPQPELSTGTGPAVNAKYDSTSATRWSRATSSCAWSRTTRPCRPSTSRAGAARAVLGGHSSTIDCYWKAWQLAFSTDAARAASGFVANFIDPRSTTACHVDSCFMVMFGRYARARSRSSARSTTSTRSSTRRLHLPRDRSRRRRGPLLPLRPGLDRSHVLGWTEWEHYRNFGDRERLARCSPFCARITSGCGRSAPGPTAATSRRAGLRHGQPAPAAARPAVLQPRALARWMTWVDTTLQQVLSARLLVRMAQELGPRTTCGRARGGRAPLSLRERELWDETAASTSTAGTTGG